MTKIANQLNQLSTADARAALLKCCSSRAWVDAMISARPFASDEDVFDVARRSWFALGRQDWLEAFAGHPRIGERAGATHATTAAWSAREQAGVEGAERAVMTALVEGNRAYEAKFGHVFLICATGKSAADMLGALQERLGHDADTELGIAAEQQALITRLRLARLVPE